MRVHALLLAIPALLTAVVITAFELPLLHREGPASTTLTWPEAVRSGALASAYRFVEAGEDPNRDVVLVDADLTGGRPLRVSPLLIAVARRDENMVMMLMSAGARLDVPGNRFAVCLAERLGAPGVAAILRLDAQPPATDAPCPEGVPDTGPTLSGFAILSDARD